MASQLSTSACARLHTAFRPATYTAYTRMLSDFIAFLVVAGLCLSQVSNLQVLAFMEVLYLNNFSPSNIANYLAGIKAMFIIYHLDHTVFSDNRIQLYLKSLKINRPFQPHIPQIVDEYLLARIISACDHFPNQILFKALYTISIFPSFVYPTCCLILLKPLMYPDIYAEVTYSSLKPQPPYLLNGRKLSRIDKKLKLLLFHYCRQIFSTHRGDAFLDNLSQQKPFFHI